MERVFKYLAECLTNDSTRLQSRFYFKQQQFCIQANGDINEVLFRNDFRSWKFLFQFEQQLLLHKGMLGGVFRSTRSSANNLISKFSSGRCRS